MQSFKNIYGKCVVEAMIKTIQDNADYLSEIDGAIGDGDHGVNMRKGFNLCAKELNGKELCFTDSLNVLGRVLMMEIGGSVGPLYGQFFRSMAKAGKGQEYITREIFLQMLNDALSGIQKIGGAKVGDKTLVDALVPAIKAYEEENDFFTALKSMVVAAEKGKDSTKDLIAKLGRSSRLGERSRGYLDAGATSCFLLLKSMSNEITKLLSH